MQSARSESIDWTSRAWACALLLILSDAIVLSAIRLAFRTSSHFASWWGTPTALVVSVTIQAGLWIVITYAVSGSVTPRAFLRRVGLSERPTVLGWCSMGAAITIAFFNLYGAARGWTASSKRPYDDYGFTPVEFCFSFLKSSLLVPLCEETATRGFLYSSFRESYSSALSTGLVLGFSAYFHRGLILHSLFTCVCLGSLWILLCVLRERSSSLWNCILCHGAYNAVIAWN